MDAESLPEGLNCEEEQSCKAVMAGLRSSRGGVWEAGPEVGQPELLPPRSERGPWVGGCELHEGQTVQDPVSLGCYLESDKQPWNGLE